MPTKDTFSCKPIGEFVKKYLSKSSSSVDPFARNNTWANYTNDINPNLSFGWNTTGMGISRGFQIQEVLLVCHGGAHNDTICIAEKRIK